MSKFVKFSLVVVLSYMVIQMIFNDTTSSFDVNTLFYITLVYGFGYLTAVVDLFLSYGREKSLIFKF